MSVVATEQAEVLRWHGHIAAVAAAAARPPPPPEQLARLINPSLQLVPLSLLPPPPPAAGRNHKNINNSLHLHRLCFCGAK